MLGDRAIEKILEARRAGGPFRSLHEFLERVDAGALDRRNLESLVKCGAFASLNAARSQLNELLPSAVQWAAMRRENRRTGQLSIFGGGAEAPDVPKPPELDEWPADELLRCEKETLGFYLTGNPLLKYEALLADLSTAKLEAIAEMKEWETLTVGGVITSARTHVVKTGANKGQRMMSFSFMDLTGAAEAVVFTETYEKYRRHLAEDRIVFLQATITARNDQPQLRVDEVIPVERAAAELTGQVRVRVHAAAMEPARLAHLRQILAEHSGPAPVLMEVMEPNGTLTRLELGPECRVAPDELLAMEVADLFGPGSLRLVPKPRDRRGGTSRLFRRPPAVRNA
jgi:DNA polymerase-3 subunit alpha